MVQSRGHFLCGLAAAIALGCASTPEPAEPETSAEPAGATASEGSGESSDPWEGFNRSMFRFNEAFDIYLFRPVAVGWDWAVPELVQTGLRNIYANARFPVVFLNQLLQGKPVRASQDLGRFLLNTTLGLGGMLDPAKEAGWYAHDEDFGQTLGTWGVPPGPYLVLPFLGPSSPRHVIGRTADAFSQPYTYFLPIVMLSTAIAIPDAVNTRARYIEEVDENRRTALDFYAFQRNAYRSYREALVNDDKDVEMPLRRGYYYMGQDSTPADDEDLYGDPQDDSLYSDPEQPDE